MYNNELYHYGVLGMKWGRRKRRNSIVSDDYAKGHTKKSITEMSNDELRDVINRQQLETQYKQTLSKNRRRGSQMVTNILSNATNQAVTQYIAKYETKGLDYVVNMLKERRG